MVGKGRREEEARELSKRMEISSFSLWAMERPSLKRTDPSAYTHTQVLTCAHTHPLAPCAFPTRAGP